MSRFDDIERYRLFGRDLPEELLVVCTQAGRVIYQSGSLQLYLEEDLTGRNLNDFIADRQAALVIGHAQQGKPFTFEAMVRDRLFACVSEPIGENIHINFSPLTDKDGAFINTNSAAFISREINIALSLMFSALDALNSEALTQPGRTGVSVLRQNMYRMLRLSRNMLDCAQAIGGSLRLNYSEVDLAALCRQLGQRLGGMLESVGIRLTVRAPDVPVLCHVDSDRVERMLYNLLSNSIIASGQRGEVTLSLAEKADSVAITVADRGRGIESGLLPQALKKHSELSPLGQSGWSGAGFGIALVDALAKRHGGSFVITTRPEEGTLARITLPKGRGGDSLHLGSAVPDYAGGLDRTLVELSTALGKEFYQ